MARNRRGRGEASIFQRRSDGLWVGTVSLGYGANGKRVRKTVYETSKAQVLEAIRKLQTDQAAGRLVKKEKLSVSDFLAAWLVTVKDKVGAATFIRYKQLTDDYLIPAFGRIPLSKLMPLHVEMAYGSMKRTTSAGSKEATPNTRKAAGTVLGIALRYAVRMQLIPSNPAADVSKPRGAYREMSFMTPSQVKEFLESASSSKNYALFAVAVGSGCRLGELLALQWPDVDFEKGTIEVRRSVSQVGSQFILKEPKTKSGRRTVVLPSFACTALHDHRREALGKGKISAPVFCTSGGTYFNKTNVRREFLSVVARANGRALEKAENAKTEAVVIPESIRFHDLRHSHASCLISAGHSVKAVSRRLGHSDITMTLKTYAHLLPDDDAKLAAGSGVLFG